MEVRNGSSILRVPVVKMAVFDLELIISTYDQKIVKSLQNKEYKDAENHLSEFCFAILEMTEEEQLFVARTFFTSIVTDVLKTLNRKGRLHPRVLSKAYELIAEIEEWENISVFILSIPNFMESLIEGVISNDILFDGCTYIEKALQLIHNKLDNSKLSVKWLADQLNISTTHLTNLFKLQIGETVSDYIAKRKLTEICYELTNTNKSLKEIRETYGFMNHSYFIQYFKKHKGMTPLKFKQKKFTETE